LEPNESLVGTCGGTRAPLRRTEPSCGSCRSESREARNWCGAACNDDVLAFFRTLYEARQLRLGRVDGMSLLHAFHLGQRQLANQPYATGLASLPWPAALALPYCTVKLVDAVADAPAEDDVAVTW
jgi:hypothetical protein